MTTAAPSPGRAPTQAVTLPAPEQLPDDLDTLKRMILELLATLHERDRDYETLRHRLDLLLRRLYGPRGERVDPNQLLLFGDLAPDQDTAAPTEPVAAPKPQRRCRPHGRRRLPENLPREPRHYELSEAERVCPDCGQVRIDIGVDRSEQLDYRPASLVVIEHFVHKYACLCSSQRPPQCHEQQPQASQEPEPMPARPADARAPIPSGQPTSRPRPTETRSGPASTGQQPTGQAPTPPCQLLDASQVVIAASKPAMPIAKGLPGPGLLANLIVSKYTDHLPLHRLERVYQRQGLFLHRSTLCDWLAACADLLRPLYELMVSLVLQSRALYTDDTTVKMQELVTHLLSTARLWVYLGDAAHPYNVFDFTVNRKRDGPQQFLANHQGYLHADAFSGYDGLPTGPAHGGGAHHRSGLQCPRAPQVLRVARQRRAALPPGAGLLPSAL
jgi:transposase